MADVNQTTATGNWLEEPKNLPSMINVLTILTFIGSGMGALGAIYGFFAAQSNYDKEVRVQDKLDQLPDFFKKMMGPDPIEMARRQLDNRLPILLLTLVGALLCLYGAFQMRKLKKAGFSIYIIGDIIPFISIFIFIGIALMAPITLVFSILFTVVFLILYATQLKYMS